MRCLGVLRTRFPDKASFSQQVYKYTAIPGAFLLHLYGYIVVLAAVLFISDALLQTSLEQFYRYTITLTAALLRYDVILAAVL